MTDPACRIFVGNLSWGTTDESLSTAFSSIGQVTDAKVIMDRFTNRSRGFGFVTYANKDDANRAIDQMNGVEVDGRNVRVDTATSQRN